MRCARGLWPSVVSVEALYAAARRALRGKRDRRDAAAFFLDLEDNLIGLRRELESGDYQPGGYRTFWIRDPKERLISVAPFRDRVVQQALVAAIEPAFERRFIDHSYACRRGKGTHRALRRFTTWARTSRYVLKMDVRKYFPSIDHEAVKGVLARTIGDREVLALCGRIIDHSNPQEDVVAWFPGDDLLTPLQRRRGLPIGNLTSQLFANAFLDPLDHFIKERLRVRRYLRYMDDFACFGDDKQELREIRAAVVGTLAAQRLRLNDGKSRLRRVDEGIQFLGFVVRPDSLRLAGGAVRRQRRRIHSLQRRFRDSVIDIDDIRTSLEAWNAHAAHGTTGGLRRAVFRGAMFSRG